MKKLVVGLLMILMLGCTLTPTKKFETVESRNAIFWTEVEKQSGRPETRDRMSCYAFYKAEAERCYENPHCSNYNLNKLERKRDRYRLGFCRMRIGKFRW